ncbi:neural cell adhesion molecule 1-like [Haliotis asinina]
MPTREMLQVLVLMTFRGHLVLCGDITLEESSTPAILGHPFTFSCNVTGGGKTGLILFQIKKNDTYATVCRVDVDTGVQLTNNNSFLCSRDEFHSHTYSLIIRKVSTRDRSRWMCQSGEMQSNTIDLDVLYPPSLDIRSVHPCTGYTFFLNQNASLNCSVTAANPFPYNFTWYHGRKVVGRDQIYTMHKVYKSSSGLYRCVAHNGILPPGEDNVTVDIHSPPVVHIAETQSIVNVSGDLTIHCKADAYPEVTSVVWTKIDVGGRISENGTLRLRDIQKDDAGIYVCTATNKVTSCSGVQLSKMSSEHLTLEVRHAPEIMSFDVTPGGRRVTEHDNVTLQCHISSNPASVIEIRNITSILRRGTSGELLEASIDDVGCLQTGPYTCSARNMLGQSAKQNISLQVKCAPRPYGSTTDRYVFRSVLGGNVTLQLIVIGFPEPTFTWRRTRNARPLNNSKVNTDGARVTGSVSITDVKKEDFQNYTVEVSNSEGTLSENIVLISASMPDTPTDLQALSVSTQSVTLRWEKGFNGGATQRFNIQYRQPGGQWTTHPTSPTEDETLQLDIDGLDPGTVYEIRINSQNEHGTSNYTNTIAVETESVNPGLIAATVTAVIVVVLVGIIITVVLVKRNRERVKADDPGSIREEVEEIGKMF